MLVALNSKRERVHISNAKNNEKYFCPICNEEVIRRIGKINSHHFSHRINSQHFRNDNWHYDMSEWHYSWQNQFPSENQEVVFKFGEIIHRADVFINNTILEFQHSPITLEEFNDRTSFYISLGYKVIWIFDCIDKSITHRFDYTRDNVECLWTYPLKILNDINYKNSKLEVYLQIDKSLWNRYPEYKRVSNSSGIKIVSNLLKVYELINGINHFLSDDYYSDYEFINNICNTNINHKQELHYKKSKNIHRLSDEIYNYHIDFKYDFYGYCPILKEEFFSHKQCHECTYLDTISFRCNCRFSDLIKKENIEVLKIKHDRDGRIFYILYKENGKLKEYYSNEIPFYTNTLLEFANKLKDKGVARFININTKKVIQLSRYNMKTLIYTKECLGKLCYNYKATLDEYEIYDWDKSVWLLVWFAD